MLVLSRQIHETLMIGESIRVTVASIHPEMITLFVRYEDQTQRVEQKLALEVDDRLEITNEVHVYVVEIRGDLVRLGVVAPADCLVSRAETHTALQSESSLVGGSHADAFSLQTNDIVLVGEHLQLLLTRADSGDCQVRSRGQLVGGARDGEEFERHDPISVGSTLDFGSLVRVRVVKITRESVGLKIEHPMHMICRTKD